MTGKQNRGEEGHFLAEVDGLGQGFLKFSAKGPHQISGIVLKAR